MATSRPNAVTKFHSMRFGRFSTFQGLLYVKNSNLIQIHNWLWLQLQEQEHIAVLRGFNTTNIGKLTYSKEDFRVFWRPLVIVAHRRPATSPKSSSLKSYSNANQKQAPSLTSYTALLRLPWYKSPQSFLTHDRKQSHIQKPNAESTESCAFDRWVRIELGFYSPNWKEGNGGESSWSQRFLPLRWAATIVLPIRAASKPAGETPSMTLGSSATLQYAIFLPAQLSWIALLAASTSGSSGIFLPLSFPGETPQKWFSLPIFRHG